MQSAGLKPSGICTAAAILSSAGITAHGPAQAMPSTPHQRRGDGHVLEHAGGVGDSTPGSMAGVDDTTSIVGAPKFLSSRLPSFWRTISVARVSKVFQGKWTMVIPYILSEGTLRFGEIKRKLPNVADSGLTKDLRLLESYGVIRREVYPVVPPKIKYSLTQMGEDFLPILRSIAQWVDAYTSEQDSRDRALSRLEAKGPAAQNPCSPSNHLDMSRISTPSFV
jgi:DNA-binding HxlR family transcriptional regulator